MKFTMNRKTLLTTAVVSAIALGASFASAHGAPGHRGPGGFFDRLDLNKDGKITRAEAAKMAEKRFNSADANKDGAITVAEMKAKHEKMRAEWAKKRGATKDGGKRKGPSADGSRKGPGHAKGSKVGHFFEKADANKDGKITRAEAKNMENARFARVDTNKDGAITKEEMRAAHMERMKKFREGHKKGPGPKAAPKASPKMTPNVGPRATLGSDGKSAAVRRHRVDRMSGPSALRGAERPVPPRRRLLASRVSESGS